MTRKVNFLCNDCDRGFSTEQAWRTHGEGSGHNINGDLPSKEAGELRAENDILREEIGRVREAHKLLTEERAKMSQKLTAIHAVLQL